MNLRKLVWKELWERPTAMIACLSTILLGVAALVTIRHITEFSEREVGRQLETLGANILILPQAASLQDYYAADINGGTLPEEHVSTVLLANLAGVEKLSPKLSWPATIGEQKVVLTGVLPQKEFEIKAAWQTVSMFGKKKHVGCKKAASCGLPTPAGPDALTTHRTIEDLGDHDIVVGADAAKQLKLVADAKLVVQGEQFRVQAVLAPTGTVDDGRVFAHLHTVQRIAGKGEVVSAIEVMGCCEDAAGGLVPQLQTLLPEAKVVTVSQVVATQVGVNRLLAQSSIFILGVLVVVGGGSVASSTSANVRERRREIGTLMALGATPRLVLKIFLLKAVWLGLVGGSVGCVLGIAAAVVLGPQWAGVAVTPIPSLAAAAVGAALGVTLVAAYWPARRAAKLDPCTCFREV